MQKSTNPTIIKAYRYIIHLSWTDLVCETLNLPVIEEEGHSDSDDNSGADQSYRRSKLVGDSSQTPNQTSGLRRNPSRKGRNTSSRNARLMKCSNLREPKLGYFKLKEILGYRREQLNIMGLI